MALAFNVLQVGVAIGLAAAADDRAVQVVGSHKQLLLDDRLFVTVAGARFEMHKPERVGLGATPLLSPDSAWERADGMAMELYSSVLPKDEADPDSSFHCWYGMLSDSIDPGSNGEKAEQNGVVGYAEISGDLKAVTKPVLNQHRWMNGTDHNNYLAGLSSGWQASAGAREGTSVWRDPLRSLGGQVRRSGERLNSVSKLPTVAISRRRDCHFDNVPRFIPIETPHKGRGGCSRMTVSPMALSCQAVARA